MELLELYPVGIFDTTQINRNKDNYIFFKITLTKIIMPIFTNRNDIYLLQNNTNQSFYNAYIYMYKQYFYLLQNNTTERFLVFKTQGLYYHELIFCKLVNFQKPRH